MRRAGRAVAAAAWLALAGAGAARSAAPLRIVALGTSLTASGGWTRPLADALAARRGAAASVVAIARPGANSRWIAAQIGRAFAAAPDVVLVEAAANDAAIHRGVSLAESKANLAAILAGLRRRRPGVRLVVMAMNPVHGWRGLLRWRLDAYSDAALAVARAHGAASVDFRPAWRRLPPAMLADAIPDGVHPRPEAARRIMIPVLVARLAAAPAAPLPQP